MKPGKIIRRMGYLKDQQGIANRYSREMENWDGHLQRSQDFIRGSFRKESPSTVAVLGSGWLLDVDLNELKQRFKEIWLVDIAHPPQIRKRAGESDHVKLLECDLSGGAVQKAWDYSRQKNRPTLEEFTSKLKLEMPIRLQPDAIISLNLLSQLDIILCDYLEKVLPYGDLDFRNLRHKIQAFHMDWISKSPAVLICDTEEASQDRKGNEAIRPLVHVTLPGGIREDSWSWTFDTRGSYRHGMKISMKVSAMEWA